MAAGRVTFASGITKLKFLKGDLKAILVDLLQTAVCAPLGALVLWKMPVFRPREMPHIRRRREIGRVDGEI